MKRTRRDLATVLALLCTGCIFGSGNNGTPADADAGNNGGADAAANNGNNGSNNGTSNNGTPNNGTPNNGTPNNGTGDEIWAPTPGTTWQWQIDGATIDTTVDAQMYDIDLFDTSTAIIDALHDDGRIVVCYFSAGTYEDWRSDAGEFDEVDYGTEHPDWPGEFYLDIRSPNVKRVMEGRLDLAVTKGCDGVEPDNVDIYDAETGFTLSSGDQVEFNTFLAQEAHRRGLSVGLKNALELVTRLEPEFDWALNEECYDYDECSELQPFLNADKAVFHVEYVDEPSMGEAKRAEVCGNVPAGFSTLIKTWDLDAWRLTCD